MKMLQLYIWGGRVLETKPSANPNEKLVKNTRTHLRHCFSERMVSTIVMFLDFFKGNG